ncbi:MAG: B-box zinc finger protein [Acidimicrobiales bacterium]
MASPLLLPGFAECDRHEGRPAVARCEVCQAALCQRCAVVVPHQGTVCVACAMERGGVHLRRARRPEPDGAESRPHESDLAIRLFEERVGERPPHPLISGLTEHLVEAGVVDPGHTVDVEALYAELAHLRDVLTPTCPDAVAPRHHGGFVLPHRAGAWDHLAHPVARHLREG